MISFSCQKCGAAFRLQDNKAGMKCKCPKCGAVIVILMAAAQAASNVTPPSLPPAVSATEPSATRTAPVDALGHKSRLPLVLGICGGIAVLAAIAVILVIGKIHDQIAYSSVSGIPVQRLDGGVARGRPLRPLDYEAAKYAVEFWKLTKLGDSFYIMVVTGSGKTILEFRQAMVCVDSSGLTEADKLNGVEWRGQVYLNYSVARAYKDHNAFLGPANRWSDWGRLVGAMEPSTVPPGLPDDIYGMGRFVLEKRSGKWIGGEDFGVGWGGKRIVTIKQVDKSDIPK